MGGDVNQVSTKEGKTAIFDACYIGNFKICQILLKNHAKLDFKVKQMWNFDAISAACFKSKYTILLMMIDSGVVTLQQIKDNAKRIFQEHGIQVFDEQEFSEYLKFFEIRKKYFDFIYARELQKKVIESSKVKLADKKEGQQVYLSVLPKLRNLHFQKIMKLRMKMQHAN